MTTTIEAIPASQTNELSKTITSSQTIITTAAQIENVFKEWNRLYRENPDDFQTSSFTDETAKVSAEHFIKLLHGGK